MTDQETAMSLTANEPPPLRRLDKRRLPGKIPAQMDPFMKHPNGTPDLLIILGGV